MPVSTHEVGILVELCLAAWMMVSECFLVEGLVRFIDLEALFERLIVAESTGLLDLMLGLL